MVTTVTGGRILLIYDLSMLGIAVGGSIRLHDLGALMTTLVRLATGSGQGDRRMMTSLGALVGHHHFGHRGRLYGGFSLLLRSS